MTMPLYIFDTDSLSLYRRAHQPLVQRVEATDPQARAATVISVEEQLSGWQALLRRAKTPAQLAFAYQSMTETVTFLAQIHILTFTEPAIMRFNALRAARLYVVTMDLRIAAIALENEAIVITRNLRDFQRVPELACENWAD